MNKEFQLLLAYIIIVLIIILCFLGISKLDYKYKIINEAKNNITFNESSSLVESNYLECKVNYDLVIIPCRINLTSNIYDRVCYACFERIEKINISNNNIIFSGIIK